MKFLHLSDLHLGKRVNETSLLDEQLHILQEILRLADEECPDALLISGDVYDKSVPSGEAVQLFDDFLSELSVRKIRVLIISGNHDSAERIAFGGRILDKGGVHVSPVYDGKMQPVLLSDAYGEVAFYLMPFLKPAQVRRFFEGETVENYTDAVRLVIRSMDLDTERRNVLLAHQFVTGAQRSESEDVTVGGLDNVDASVFSGFDYVALGHLHRAQDCGAAHIRYCGSPLKYSFSEANDSKSLTLVELGPKGKCRIRPIPLQPLHDWQDFRGSYDELVRRSFYENTTFPEDFVRITLTDEEDIPDAIGKLRIIYRNLLELRYDNKRTRASGILDSAGDVSQKSPLALFSELYEIQNGEKLSETQENYLQRMIAGIWEENA